MGDKVSSFVGTMTGNVKATCHCGPYLHPGSTQQQGADLVHCWQLREGSERRSLFGELEHTQVSRNQFIGWLQIVFQIVVIAC